MVSRSIEKRRSDRDEKEKDKYVNEDGIKDIIYSKNLIIQKLKNKDFDKLSLENNINSALYANFYDVDIINKESKLIINKK